MNDKDYETELRAIKTIITNNGYPERLIENMVNKKAKRLVLNKVQNREFSRTEILQNDLLGKAL